jgi:NTE family protein
MWRSTSSLFESSTMLNRFGPASDDAVDDAEPVSESDSDDELVDSGREAAVPKMGSFEVMNRTIDIAQAALARHTLAAYPPDLLIEVPRSACRSLEFHRAAEVIDIGHELAAQAIKALAG